MAMSGNKEGSGMASLTMTWGTEISEATSLAVIGLTEISEKASMAVTEPTGDTEFRDDLFGSVRAERKL